MRTLVGVPEDIVLIPLIGHTLGHAGVSVRSGARWLFQAGDAYFFHGEMNVDAPHCTPGHAFYQRMMTRIAQRANATSSGFASCAAVTCALNAWHSST